MGEPKIIQIYTELIKKCGTKTYMILIFEEF